MRGQHQPQRAAGGVDLAPYKGRVPVEMVGAAAFPPVGDLPYALSLPPTAFTGSDWPAMCAARLVHDRSPVEDLAVLVLFDGWNSLFRDQVVPWRIAMASRTLGQFENELLPRFIARQRRFAGCDSALARHIADHAVLAEGGRDWLITLLDAEAAPEAVRWFAPFALAWEDHEDERLRLLAAAALAKVRMQAQVGVLGDAAADELFCRAVVHAVGASRELRSAQGRLRFQPTAACRTIVGNDADGLAGLRALPQARHSALILGERLFLKLLAASRPASTSTSRWVAS